MWWKPKPAPERDLTQEQRERADRAKTALPVMYEVCADVREKLLEQIVLSGPANAQEREYFYHAVKGLDAVVAMTEVYAQRQDMAAALETFRQKVKS